MTENEVPKLKGIDRLVHVGVRLFDTLPKIVFTSAMTAMVITWFIVSLADVPREWLIGAPLIALLGSTASTYVIGKILFALQERIKAQNYLLAAQTAALQKANAELEETNSELDAFASTVAHDIKSPLATLAGYANLLRDDWAELGELERRQILYAMEQSALKMTDIVDEILLFSQARHNDSVAVSALDMQEIVGNALSRLCLEVENCAADVIMPEHWPTAVGYAPWVEEIWVNYLSNALKYGGDPPRLELGAEPESDGTVRFWVVDNGTGLSFSQQQQLFTEFTRLHSEIQGTGLGLSIVRRMTEKLGGYAGVESAVGMGSCFYFTLPTVG